MKRRDFIALAGASAAVACLPTTLTAQQAKTKRLAALLNGAQDDPETKVRVAAFWAGLGKYGWNDNNLSADYRWDATTADAVLKPAAELVAQKPDVLVVSGSAGLTALARLTKTVPIVFAGTSAATVLGLVQSFARPGGNITGFVNTPDDESYGKSIDLLRDLMPAVSKIAVVFNPDSIPGGQSVFLATFVPLAAKQGLGVSPFPVRTPSDISDAMRSIAADVNLGLIVPGDAWVSANRTTAIAEAAKYRLVAVYRQQVFATDGGLISYAVDLIPVFRGAGEYAGLVLNGTNPADLPIQSSPLALTVNLKTAMAQGISIPLSVLTRADQVIE